MKNPIVLFITLLILTGCISMLGGITSSQEEKPPEGYSEIRCTCLNGEGRYGGFITNYVKGDAEYCKLTMYSILPDGAEVSCADDGIKFKINSDYVKSPELENGVEVFEEIE